MPYTDVKDNDVTVTETDIKNFYDEHKQEFAADDAVRQLDYVVFDINPSPEDFKKATEDINKIKLDFQKIDNKDVPNFVNSNSDIKYDSAFYAKGKITPVRLDSFLFNASKGEIFGPFIDNSNYYIAKLMDVQMRPDSMKAKHILISYQGAERADQNVKRSKKDAKRIADSILNVLKSTPMQFEAIARKMSNDPSAKEKGGDLGWFADGSMVYPFNKACLDNKVGSRVVAESIFGYHVIEITGKKDPVKKVVAAIIKRAIEAIQRLNRMSMLKLANLFLKIQLYSLLINLVR